jgi:segregation and condensation protein A
MADTAGVTEASRGEAAAPAPSPDDVPQLRLGAYEGPLDLLLDLARAHRMDLSTISVVAMVEQAIVAIEHAITARRVPLSAIGDWVVTAATLLALRTRLLLPAGNAENREAEREATALRRQLVDRAAAQALASWLDSRLQLGRDLFGRGAREPKMAGPPVADLTELLRACLRLLETSARERVYRPSPPPLWRVPDALEHVRWHLAQLPYARVELTYLVPHRHALVRSLLQRRAALASVLLAGLELAREGKVDLQQACAFGPITVSVPKITVSGPIPDCAWEAMGRVQAADQR